MAKDRFDFSDFEMTGSAGIDSHFVRQASSEPTKYRKKVANLGDLSGFIRNSNNQLIHKSNRDLWSLKKEADGSFYIERLFDDNGTPLKG